MRIRRTAFPLLMGFAFCASLQIHAAEVRILFSSSLNGNLDGCTCRVQPISGLVKRGAFVEAYRKTHPQALLIDTGDMVIDPRKTRLNASILKSYRLLGYDAVVPGDQDLRLGLETLSKFNVQVPLLAANVWSGGSFFRKDVRVGRTHLSIRRGGAAISITGIMHPDSTRFARGLAKKAFRFTDPLLALQATPAADLFLVLSHSGQQHDTALGRRLGRPALFFGGHDQVLLEAPVVLADGVTYFQPGRDGDRLGEVVVLTLGGGRYRILSHRLHRFSTDTSPDHPAIRQLIREAHGNQAGH